MMLVGFNFLCGRSHGADPFLVRRCPHSVWTS